MAEFTAVPEIINGIMRDLARKERAVKQLKIISDGTGANTRFELVDEEAGTVEPIDIPCESVEWRVYGGGLASVRIRGWNASLSGTLTAKVAISELDREIGYLTDARNKLAGKETA